MSKAGTDSGTSSELMDWESFAESVARLAELQFTDDWNPEQHVADVTDLMTRLDLECLATWEGDHLGRLDTPAAAHITRVFEEAGFEAARVDLSPGELIELHDHPGMTGVIMCVTGEVQVESYEELSERSVEGKLLLRQIASVLLTSGQTASLTPTRGNIHSVRAVRHARLIDIFTPRYDAHRIRQSRRLQRASRCYEGRSGVYEAWED